MARIFNIYFVYNERMHNAIVSVRITAFFTEYTLNNLEEELLALLPGNKIVSQSAHHFVFKDASSENSSALMDAIIKAVAEHLHIEAR
jgi:hypothetical protein